MVSSSTPTTHVLASEAARPRLSAEEAAARASSRKGRLALIGLGTCIAAAAFLREPQVARGDRREAVARLVEHKGLRAQPGDVVFVDGPKGLLGAAFQTSRVLVRASNAMMPGPEPGTMVPADEDQPTDIYLFEARMSPSGALLDLDGGYNLSDTTGADETVPIVVGDHVAYASNSGIEGAPSIVTILDFDAGTPAPKTWPLSARLQHGVTNLQATGRWKGIGRTRFVVKLTEEVDLQVREGALVVGSGSSNASLLLANGSIPSMPEWVERQPSEIAEPGNLVTWSVDRVRLEIGDDNMQALKDTYFKYKDYFIRKSGGSDVTEEEAMAQIVEEAGEDVAAPTREIPIDPETGWPPAPLEAWVTPSLEGEGVWKVKEDASFYRSQPNLPPTFMTTFIRSDRLRKDTRVFIMEWDPRMIELHMQAGTVEPKGATGKAGPGLIPRTADVMKRVVAASNAGFQALHGEFGMMADGVVYLPPKPYAATVMKLRDGSTAFGTWPNDATVPDRIVSYRQNMTVMVQDEAFNPYDRTWWGGTVPGAEDKTHTVRTGICLTKERFVAYFYGADLSPEALAQAMIQARCSYGIALDMNAGHSGLEFYKVAPTEDLGSLGRPLDYKWEAEGEVSDMPGWSFRAKRLIKGMGLMNFPRYIKREARDYFYLTLRYVVPGDNLPVVNEPAAENEGAWTTKDLPQHGYPYAIALSETRPDKSDAALSFRILQVDPRAVAGAVLGSAEDDPKKASKTILYVDPGAAKGSTSLWQQGRAFFIASEPPGKGALKLAQGEPTLATGAALACVHDESGMMYYAEIKGANTGARGKLSGIAELFTSLGCVQQIALAEPLQLVLGDSTDIARALVHPPKSPSTIRLVRGESAGGARFFEDTPVVPRSEWYPLQQQRIRYHKKAAP